MYQIVLRVMISMTKKKAPVMAATALLMSSVEPDMPMERKASAILSHSWGNVYLKRPISLKNMLLEKNTSFYLFVIPGGQIDPEEEEQDGEESLK